jgi:hypothetical protein
MLFRVWTNQIHRSTRWGVTGSSLEAPTPRPIFPSVAHSWSGSQEKGTPIPIPYDSSRSIHFSVGLGR